MWHTHRRTRGKAGVINNTVTHFCTLGEVSYTMTCVEYILSQRAVLIGFTGLTRRTDYRPDGWHRDGCRWDGYQRVRMPAPVALLGRPRVHGRGYWTLKTDTENNVNTENWAIEHVQHIVLLKICDFSFVFRVKDLPALSPKSAVRYPWPWGPKETWEGLSKGGRPSTPRPLVGPFTLRAVGTGDTHVCT